MERLIVDTDILIDVLRQQPQAKQFFYKHKEAFAVSAVNLLELYAGFKGEDEERDIRALRTYLDIMPITEEIAVKAGYYRNRYGKSHGTGIIDCMVAATAVAENATLVTLNKKHYPMLDKVLVPYKKS